MRLSAVDPHSRETMTFDWGSAKWYVRPVLAGHGDRSPDPWLNPILSLPGLLHPNENGQRLGYPAALTPVTG